MVLEHDRPLVVVLGGDVDNPKWSRTDVHPPVGLLLPLQPLASVTQILDILTAQQLDKQGPSTTIVEIEKLIGETILTAEHEAQSTADQLSRGDGLHIPCECDN